jgi:hypothetical protein
LAVDHAERMTSEQLAAPVARPVIERRVPWPSLLALALFSTLAVINTLPLVTRFTTALPGAGGDAVQYLWYTWWLRFALEQGITPFESPLVFWPYGANLYIGTTAIAEGLVSLPVQWLAGPIVTYNVLLLAKLALSAFCAYLLAVYLWRDRWAALLGGIAYGFCTYLAAHALAHMALLSVMFMPLAALWLFRAAAGVGRRYVLLAALALVANVPMLHYALYMGLFIALFLIWQTIRLGADLPLLRHIWLRVLATGLLAAALSTPLLALMLSQGERLAGDSSAAYAYGADLLAYVVHQGTEQRVQ